MIPVEIPGLTMTENAIFAKCLNQIADKLTRNLIRQRYYDSKQIIRQLGIAVPPQLSLLETVSGWPSKAVDILDRRIGFDSLVASGESDPFGVDQIFAENEIEFQASQIHTAALKYGTTFLPVVPGDVASGDPAIRIVPRSALEMTGIYDRSRRRLRAALSINRNEAGQLDEFLFILPDRWVTGWRVGTMWRTRTIPHNLGHVPVGIVAYRPDLDRPFGKSKISRAIMSLTDQGVRTMLRTEIAAEFFSVPQRYVLGANEEAFVDRDGNPRTGWEVTIGNILALSRDEDTLTGDGMPTVGQFPQMSMQPHTEHLRTVASAFAGEANIPVGSLGIIHDNPASDAAMQTAYLDLVQDAERCHTTFGTGYVKAAQFAVMLRDGLDAVPDELRTMRARFRNASTPTKAAQTQAVVEQVREGILPADSEVTLEELGYSKVTIQRIKSDRRRAQAGDRLSALREAVSARQAERGTAGALTAEEE
ncbi:portal protein [Arthrobacter phage CallinAllBarbz]|uniref:Portal protein n=1 Tax=Arthrobacter phage CallinAllBarbz TaxID=3077790 RepID=A0AA96HJA1_9CAUD|nr:portal protein [Arthrobacter phage CallinAllBarbz]